MPTTPTTACTQSYNNVDPKLKDDWQQVFKQLVTTHQPANNDQDLDTLITDFDTHIQAACKATLKPRHNPHPRELGGGRTSAPASTPPLAPPHLAQNARRPHAHSNMAYPKPKEIGPTTNSIRPLTHKTSGRLLKSAKAAPPCNAPSGVGSPMWTRGVLPRQQQRS